MLTSGSCTLFFTWMSYVVFDSGGFGRKAQNFLMVCPMVVVVVQGRGYGMIWLGMVLIQVAVMAGLHASGYYDGRPAAETLRPLSVLIVTEVVYDIGAMCAALSFQHFYDVHLKSLRQVLHARAALLCSLARLSHAHSLCLSQQPLFFSLSQTFYKTLRLSLFLSLLSLSISPYLSQLARYHLHNPTF